MKSGQGHKQQARTCLREACFGRRRKAGAEDSQGSTGDQSAVEMHYPLGAKLEYPGGEVGIGLGDFGGDG